MRRVVTVVLLLASVLAAQTPERIGDAIARLAGPREDARAIELLIDAGEAAVEPICRELRDAAARPADPQWGRALRALRAMGPRARAAVPPLVDVLATLGPFDGSSRRGTQPLLGDVLTTIGDLLGYVERDAEEVHRRLLAELTPGGTRVALRFDFPFAATQRALRTCEILAVRGAAPGIAGLSNADDALEWEFAIRHLADGDRAALPELVDIRQGDSPRKPVRVDHPFWSTFTFPQDRATQIVHDAAEIAIARIDPEDPNALDGLAWMVEHADDPRDRVRAAAVLGRHGPAARGHVDVLVRVLLAEDERLVAEAITSIGLAGGRSEPLAARMRALTTDPRPGIARRAAAALRLVEGRSSRGG